MKKILLFQVAIFLLAVSAFAQTSINTDGSAPNNSAMLDIKHPNKGLLIPRVALTGTNDVTTIPSPATSLLVYNTASTSGGTNTVTAGFYYWNGSQWNTIGDNLGNHILTQNLQTNGNYISVDGSSTGIQMQGNGAFRVVTTNSNLPSNTGERFKFDQDGGFVAFGDLGVGTIPTSGIGHRMMWYPGKGAFRVGVVDGIGGGSGTEWDDVNIGDYSVAVGHNCMATKYGSFAGGDGCIASGTDAFSYGSLNISSGTIGFTFGANNVAGGFGSTAIGYTDIALGQGSVAIGYRCTASADYSVALGYRASSNFHSGCMVMGDESTTDSIRSSADNQFSARYAGGYRFFTNASLTTGVVMNAGDGSWSSVSDSTKKENFLKADANVFLDKLSRIRLGSWNYKGTSAATKRHYGPMAQDIYAAFGKDKYGKIGCDTLLSTIDMDGIMMIMLQGLEKRTSDQTATIKSLTTELASVKNENAELKGKLAKVEQMQEQILALQNSMENLKSVVSTTANAETKDNIGKSLPNKDINK